MIEVDLDEQRHLVIAVDGVGTRTVISLPHEDGHQLLHQLTEYYGRIEFGQGTDEQATKPGLMARIFGRKKA